MFMEYWHCLGYLCQAGLINKPLFLNTIFLIKKNIDIPDLRLLINAEVSFICPISPRIFAFPESLAHSIYHRCVSCTVILSYFKDAVRLFPKMKVEVVPHLGWHVKDHYKCPSLPYGSLCFFSWDEFATKILLLTLLTQYIEGVCPILAILFNKTLYYSLVRFYLSTGHMGLNCSQDSSYCIGITSASLLEMGCFWDLCYTPGGLLKMFLVFMHHCKLDIWFISLKYGWNKQFAN